MFNRVGTIAIASVAGILLGSGQPSASASDRSLASWFWETGWLDYWGRGEQGYVWSLSVPEYPWEWQYDPEGDLSLVINDGYVLEQPPNQENGFYSDVDCGECTYGIQVIAEQFLITDPQPIFVIRFWGGYWPFDIGEPDQFTVIIRDGPWPDEPPGDIWQMCGPMPATTKELTGDFVAGVPEYEYTIELEFEYWWLELEPGWWWIEIYNDTSLVSGACCRPSGYCSEMTESACDSSGWDYQGDFTDCDPNPCVPPTGACCYGNGDCDELTQDACYAAGGEAWASGWDCTPNPCTGACCLAGGDCQEDLTLDECQALDDAESWGLNGECADCPPPLADGDLCGFQIWIGSDADPVNTATGNFHHAETDFSIASRGRPLVFQRYYNSLNPDAGTLGPGWMHSYDSVLYPEAGEDEVAIRWADGRIDRWADVGGGTYEPAQWDCHDELVYDAGTWTVTKTNLEVHQFDADGKLTSITDKNANAFMLAYNMDDQLETVTDPVGRWLTLSYYPDGLLQSVADWTGRTVQYSYDASGRLEHVTDILLNTIDYTYDANGYLATINDQSGVTVVTNEYDLDGRVLRQWDGNGNETEFIYGGRAENETIIRRYLEDRGGRRAVDTIHAHDPEFKKQLLVENALAERVDYGYWNFERTEIVDRNGNTTKFDYDTRGNVIKATEADETATTTVAYDHPSLDHVPTQRTDALNNATDWSYDTAGNVESEVRWQDVEQTEYVEKSWTYNDEGQRETQTDERGNVHQWIYDENGLLIEELGWDYTDPENPVDVSHTWYGYDDLWRRIWVVDGRGTGPEDESYKTYYFYDDAGRLIRIEGPPVGDPPQSIVQWFGYDNIGNRLWVTDGRGTEPLDPNHTTHYEYDDNNNLIRVTDAQGGQTQYEYDQLNRKVKMADANGNLTDQYTRYEYDDADRLIEREDPEGNVWTYTYDPQGNVLTQADPSGVVITHEYDELNRRVLTYDELMNQTHFEYDELGRLIRQTDANGNLTEFQYDALGRLVCVIDAAGGWTEYTYDAAGNLIQIEDAKDDVLSIREYDALGRLVYADDGIGNYYTYGYDPVGNQTEVTDANGDTTYLTYDAANRLIQIDYPDDTWVTYEYDNNGNRTGMSEPEGASSFEYDELNRLTSSQDRYGQTVGYNYDAVGNRTALAYPPDDRQVTYVYDTANRLTTVTDWAARQTTHTYACCYRIETVTYPNGVVETRTYDLAGRLESMNTEDSGGTPLLSFVWQERDGLGNPTTVTETGTLQPTLEQLVTEYEYDADNRLVESSQGTYQYDANGNLTARTVDGVTTTFAYDYEDRLVSQTTDVAAGPRTGRITGKMPVPHNVAAGPRTGRSQTVQHVYDGAGHRIARIDNDAEKRYVLDRGRSMSHVLCETDDTGVITAYHIYGRRLIARIEADGTPHYYHTNDIASVAALTDQNGVITDRYSYTPFGLLAHEGTTDNPFTYVGTLGVMTEADDLYFMRARFYDPDTGRFLGKDPVLGALTEPQGLHRYAYVLSNPVVRTDPSGLLPPIPDVYGVTVLGFDEWPDLCPPGPGIGDVPPRFVSETIDPEIIIQKVMRERATRGSDKSPSDVFRDVMRDVTKETVETAVQALGVLAPQCGLYVRTKVGIASSYPARAYIALDKSRPILEVLAMAYLGGYIETRFDIAVPPTPPPFLDAKVDFSQPSWWPSWLIWNPSGQLGIVEIDVSGRSAGVK